MNAEKRKREFEKSLSLPFWSENPTKSERDVTSVTAFTTDECRRWLQGRSRKAAKECSPRRKPWDSATEN